MNNDEWYQLFVHHADYYHGILDPAFQQEHGAIIKLREIGKIAWKANRSPEWLALYKTRTLIGIINDSRREQEQCLHSLFKAYTMDTIYIIHVDLTEKYKHSITKMMVDPKELKSCLDFVLKMVARD